MAIGDTHSDGTVVWKEDFLMGIGKLPLVIGYNHKETYTTSGTFVAPMTGLYRITLQGGGGGGGGSSYSTNQNQRASGGGGGSGASLTFYETLTAGIEYSYTIGAGGEGGTGVIGNGSVSGGNVGSNGGDSSITINNTTYTAGKGYGGGTISNSAIGGNGGEGKKGNSVVSLGFTGGIGVVSAGLNAGYAGGAGGGAGGKRSGTSGANFGGGGSGGISSLTTAYNGSNGGNGYITFEWFDPADAFPSLYPAA